MRTNDMKVNYLKKVSLHFKSGTSPDRMDLTSSSPVKYEFIFGIGLEGLTPFEYELVNKSINDELILLIQMEKLASRFGHMASFILKNIIGDTSFYLKVKIVDISIPDNREIIKALASNASCDHGCDCGCGGG